MVGFLIAVLSGVLMSVQGIFNTQVTKASSIWSANVFVQATALLSCLAVWLAADRSNLFAVFRSEPKYLLLGGVLGAGITWTVIKAMAMLGPARAVLFIVVAQIAAAYLVDLRPSVSRAGASGLILRRSFCFADVGRPLTSISRILSSRRNVMTKHAGTNRKRNRQIINRIFKNHENCNSYERRPHRRPFRSLRPLYDLHDRK